MGLSGDKTMFYISQDLLKKKKLLFYVYITIYYPYCLRHAFGSAMSFIKKIKHLFHCDSNEEFPVRLIN